MAGIVTHQSPEFSLPMRYMLTSVLGFGLFALDLLSESVGLGTGAALSPAIVALTHLLTLGVLLSFVMGAVYQLVTVAFLIPVRGVKLAKVNYYAYVVGVVGLWASMRGWFVPGLLGFGSLVVLSLYVYAGIILSSLAPSAVRGPMRWFVQAAHIYLILAITMAWLMVASFTFGILSSWYTELLATHILLAVSFFSCLIFGFTYKLLPMFTLSHGFSTWRQNYVFYGLNAGIWLIVAGVWTRWLPIGILGAISATAAFVLQIFDVREMMKKRMRKKIEHPIRFTAVAVAFGATTSLLVFVFLASRSPQSVWQALVGFYLLGWVVLTVMGYSYKIVPFLIWTKRFGGQAGRDKVPTIAQLLDLDTSRLMFVAFLAGLVLLTISIGFTWKIGAVLGAVLLAIAIAQYLVHMVHVLDLRKLPKELKNHD
ncbi:hypothetical protein LLE49_16790 [Alicyclobacillus tolerans]|uniref:hypothetical protein n=1 Tax=Alicyclobacillus tolerans TaxID=90970 RepID=UPI001F450147|nr:hypothetical protein [Alicyclobacillus tolerans]MCF8566381.1 hypothetical protein [Alicyclobacillus tolerans]